MSEYSDLHLPSKPTTPGASGGASQRDRRFTDTFFDIHKHPVRFPNGRPWCGPREFSAMADRGEEPGFIGGDLQQGEHVTDESGTMVDRQASFKSVWSAPWTPLAKYFIYIYKRKLIRFDYQRMLVEEQASYDRYYEAAALLGSELNRVVDYGVMPHFQITSKLGYPTKMVKVAQAAIAGDPWLLGFTEQPNDELAKILGYKAVPSGGHMQSYTPVERAKSYDPRDVSPIVTPEQVLATPQAELLKMIAELTAAAVAQAVPLAIKAAREQEKADHVARSQAGKEAARTKREAA